MSRTAPFRCFLIGADSLLVACGDQLLQRGHEIGGVLTRTARVAAWARSNGIPVHDTKDVEALRAAPFDYLFSITHLALLPDEMLALPRKAAINFHDGPLPRYAGLNAPAWALMAGEERYGISWHIITSGVDEGDVLKSRSFDVQPDETSLTLNTKCFEAGLDGFQELIDELAEGRETRTKQDPTERSYYGRHTKPPAVCALDWARPASELEAFVRALDFGRYDNPLGVAKLQTEERVLIVTSARAHDQENDAAPGTVLGAGAEGVHVACGQGVLSITGISTTRGRSVELSEVTGTELRAGTNLALPTEFTAALDQVAEEVSKAERFWVRRLSAVEPLEIPYERHPAAAATNDSADDQAHEPGSLDLWSIQVPPAFAERYPGDSDALVCAAVSFLARIGRKQAFTLAFSDPTISERASRLRGWLADELPLNVALETTQPFDLNRQALSEELTTLRAKASWLCDLPARMTELHALDAQSPERISPVAVDICTPGAAPRVDLMTIAITAGTNECTLHVDPTRIAPQHAASMRDQLQVLLNEIGTEPDRALGMHDVLTSDMRQAVLYDWNSTATHTRAACIHKLFEAQVDLTPEQNAVVFEGEALTYRELDERANRMAAHLVERGAGPDALIGICVERSLDLMVAVLGTLKAGAAYVPLDPSFPSERLTYMVEDSGLKVVVAHDALTGLLPGTSATVVRIDSEWETIAAHSCERASTDATPSHLAYVMYTSGSTGKPKGVMVEHRNVANFFTGMDERVPRDGTAATWLAVTSLSFDISVLELLWTLARGFEVVVFLDRDRSAAARRSPSDAQTSAVRKRPMDFSLFYFSSDAEGDESPYRLLLEGARFADERGFVAVWTPERHFHRFGGSYPAPAVTGAAVAATTEHVQIRSGSVVLPLHHPIRVAESWSVVDNLSGGRVGISFASGWQPNDFVLNPDSYGRAKDVMFENIETVQKLWRGETVSFDGPKGPVEVTTLPRPVQKELPIWVTTAGNPETYERAGTLGANILTHLLGQSVEELAPKIELYRKARKEAGHDPDTGVVSLMLHTFVGTDEDAVRETVREPLKSYLASSLNLLEKYAWAFPVYSKASDDDKGDEFASLTDEEREAMLEHAFLRYYETSGLFGRPETCMKRVDELKAIGVDEVACLIDFGVPTDEAIAGLEHLDRVRALELRSRTPASDLDHSFAAQIERHGVTHMQCTPSMARMLVANAETRQALSNIRHVLVGGEAFPTDLANELVEIVPGSVTNMYGPTETTIWSATYRVDGPVDSVPIGHPIANTALYVLDENRLPVAPGVPGELYIGGDGVVRGYFGREELTAERFLDDPFEGATEGGRMYRTGDLARLDDDGTVEFLGRTDHQVKVRGYRIELGEIETVLLRQPEISEAVVVARRDASDVDTLAAYFVPAADGDTDSLKDALREALRETLPEYMVPSSFVSLPAFPITPNGKIDRLALPAPETVETSSSKPFVAPQGELEAQIAELWKEALGITTVGIDDNFFDIGGHSLLVVRMHRKLASAIDEPVSLTDLYRFPTIRKLCEHLSSDGTSGADLEGSVDRARKRRQTMQKRRARRRA